MLVGPTFEPEHEATRARPVPERQCFQAGTSSRSSPLSRSVPVRQTLEREPEAAREARLLEISQRTLWPLFDHEVFRAPPPSFATIAQLPRSIPILTFGPWAVKNSEGNLLSVL